jgi:hypothetical protein
MNKWICFYLGAIYVFLSGGALFSMTEQEILQKHSSLVESFGLKGLNTDPVKITKSWDPKYRQKENIKFVRGHGLSLTIDTETGELIEVLNYHQGIIKSKAKDEGKKVIFSLDKETCKNQLIKYYKLITGEEPPPFEMKVPAKGTLLPPTYTVSLRWQRMYKKYPIRNNYIAIGIFADTGILAVYMKKYISDLPPTVEVKISAEQARQKAIEVADKEIKDWVKFLDSISTETAISQLDDKTYRGIKSILKGKSRGIKQESQQYASLIGCKPIETKAPYLEIVNIQRDAFHRQYMQPEAYEKSHEWNPATRLCWVINLYYHNPETKVGAQFEVDIDAYDGSVVNGSRPWD